MASKFQWITGLSLVALLLGSCAGNRNTSQTPAPKPSVGQVAASPKPPVVSPSATAAPVPGLTPATNPAKISVAQGRRDPFSAVAVSPIKQTVSTGTSPTKPPQGNQTKPKPPQGNQTQPKPPQGNQTQPKPPQDKRIKNDRTPTDKNKTNPPKNNQTITNPPPNTQTKDDTMRTAPSSEGQTTIQNTPAVPPAPSTDLANAVEVKGVMNVEGKLTAIVKEPNEKTSRSVKEGDYIAKGSVLVKRIESAANEEPQVILEQNGVEVVKSVGGNGPVASLP